MRTTGRILHLMEKQVASTGWSAPAPQQEDSPLLRHLPPHRGDLHEEVSERLLQDQLDGRADSEGDHYPFVQEGQKVHCLKTKFSKPQINQVSLKKISRVENLIFSQTQRVFEASSLRIPLETSIQEAYNWFNERISGKSIFNLPNFQDVDKRRRTRSLRLKCKDYGCSIKPPKNPAICCFLLN